MNLLGFFVGCKAKARKTSSSSKGLAPRARHGRRLELEALEDRCLPSATAISGYVFYDPGNTGIMAQSATPFANSNIALVNANNVVVGTATTGSDGSYQFNQNATISTAPVTITKTFTITSQPTDINVSGVIGQFDTSLGSLQSVQITNAGSITSSIQVENTSTSSPSTINATVSGQFTLTGPNNLSLVTNVSQNAGTFNASIYDNGLDFTGNSGKNLGSNTANGSQAITLTGAAMAPFMGTSTGTVSFVENGVATSSANGGGNVFATIVSSGAAQVTVVYTYTPDNTLQPGNYTIVQLTQPTGYLPGKVSSNGVILNTPPSVRVIPVTVVSGQTNYPNNNFAELQVSTKTCVPVYQPCNHEKDKCGDHDYSDSCKDRSHQTDQGCDSAWRCQDTGHYYDGDHSESCKGQKHETDRGCDPIWTCQDTGNHYIDPMHRQRDYTPLYNVAAGQCTQQASTNGPLSGRQSQCSPNDKVLHKADDDHASKQAIGPRTKADAQTCVTNTQVASKKGCK